MAIRNLGAERSVIGNIMMDGEKVMPEAALHLTKHSFTNPICSHVFGACMALYENQQPIDVVTVAERPAEPITTRICGNVSAWQRKRPPSAITSPTYRL